MTQRTKLGGWLGEGLIILVSILVAFWIDATWDGRREAQLESALITAVVAEIHTNRVGLEAALEGTQEGLARLSHFVRMSPADLNDLRPDSAMGLIRTLARSPEHEPLLGTASSLLQTPSPDLLGIEARESVSRWLQAIADYEVEREALQRRQEALQHELARHISRHIDTGSDELTNFSRMLQDSGGPSAVVELRADTASMAAVVEMGLSQRVYVGRVRGLLALSDTLIAGLEGFVGQTR